jgi:hypothetical protein
VRHFLALLLLAASPAMAGDLDGLADAQAARSLLGPGTWARVIRIENAEARGLERRTPYPRTMYGLVFELSGILWLYCDADGTQSLSMRTKSMERDKADPGPLLSAVSSRFTSWSWVDAPPVPAGPVAPLPPNGCLIECLALLRRRIAAGWEVDSPRLLLFYVQTPFGLRGHATLVFAQRRGLAAIEPDRPDKILEIPARAQRDARSISEYVRGGGVSSARVLPLDAFGRDEGPVRLATLVPPGSPAGS